MNGIEVLEREVVFHRYYDPATGQFLSVDPLVAATGQPYSYTNDNPVNGADPLGLMTIGGYCAPGDCPTVAGTNDPIQSAPSGSTVGSSGNTTWNGGMNYSPTASQSPAFGMGSVLNNISSAAPPSPTYQSSAPPLPPELIPPSHSGPTNQEILGASSPPSTETYEGGGLAPGQSLKDFCRAYVAAGGGALADIGAFVIYGAYVLDTGGEGLVLVGLLSLTGTAAAGSGLYMVYSAMSDSGAFAC